ncbi:putative nucleotidyltransferase-like protein [Tenacibaculum adriaticum]|uniref:Putative nucleotidyltransferase-like protein n=1 Tax=Tenacibaculum adriaticum TaxID=413713 RepID=A0A5S5DPX6_9FLAO|nr:nucleotidyltransferase family protein [Tenacibaculum adriaticum]TYP98000.1 putative nucleotidyltransferase-like protein [Tenacibaculum adriaticum]
MNYKETLFFVGKCLTITHEKQNRDLVEEELKSAKIDWDNVVKLSTKHYVFSALYLNLKRADFLRYVPQDLVEYMEHITDLNRERNQQIIEQAKEINELLLSNNISPVFLKGTGNLLEGLYEDIAERMVGDIDFLVEEETCNTAFILLNDVGYNNKISELFDEHRHLPRITNDEKIAGVEIHRNMIKKKTKCFNYNTIQSTLIKKKGVSFLSFENQIKLTVYSKFINDDAYLLKKMSLRAAYDVFLLGYKLTNKLKIEEDLLSKELKAGLKVYLSALDKPSNIPEFSDEVTIKYYNTFFNSTSREKKYIQTYLSAKFRLEILLKSLFKKTYFKFVVSKFTDINWWRSKFSFKPNS